MAEKWWEWECGCEWEWECGCEWECEWVCEWECVLGVSGAVSAWDKMEGVWGIPGAENTGEDETEGEDVDVVGGGRAGAIDGSGVGSGVPTVSPSSTVSMSCHICERKRQSLLDTVIYITTYTIVMSESTNVQELK